MFRIVRILKTISSLLFMVSLLATYFYTAEKVNVYLDMEKVNFIKVEHLFFYALAIFVFVNLLFLIFDRVLISYRSRKPHSTGLFYSEKFRGWLRGFNAALNILLASSVVFVAFINSDSGYGLMRFTILLYIGPVAILIALFTLPLVFIPGRRR